VVCVYSYDKPEEAVRRGIGVPVRIQAAGVTPEASPHGFQTLCADCELLYFHTAAWSAEAEGALHPLDPTLGIRWPKPVAALSDRDRGHPFLGATGPLPAPQEAA